MDRPYGSGDTGPAFACSVKPCDEIATIVVDHHDRAEMPLCAEHWDLARSLTGATIGVVRVLPRPACFVCSCDAGAVALMGHTDGSLLPCCESHLDDLSWVVPDQIIARSGQ